jgi:hemerythrin-like metal-binding protein
MESKEFEYGIIWMDLQHSRLINWFNKLHDSCEEGTCTIEILQLSKFLEWYMLDHFEMEERYMKKFGYLEYEKHKSDHLEFSSNYSKLRASHLKKEKEVGNEFLWVLADWIMKHIGAEDSKLAEHLIKNGVK